MPVEGRAITPHGFLRELSVRCILIVVVCAVHVALPVRGAAAPPTVVELASCRRPRRRSLIPPAAIFTLLVVAPLALFSIPALLERDYETSTRVIFAWTMALLFNALLTETLKLLVGRPRPDFLYRCFPDGKPNKELQCTGNPIDIYEGRKSFPSGHSSFAFCSLGVVWLWVGGRKGAGALTAAGLVAVSRCLDNHHHAGDVLAGAALGLLVAYACYSLYYPHTNLYHTRSSQRRIEEEDMSHST